MIEPSEVVLQCEKYQQGICHSCSLIDTPYNQQLSQKQATLEKILNAYLTSEASILEPISSEISGFRYKAKMAVSGTVENIHLGLINHTFDGIDLTDCPLYPETIRLKFPLIKKYIQQAGLVPYQVKTKKGILKQVLLTESRSTGQTMIRFVLKDDSKIAKMKEHLSTLFNDETIQVISANIQPVHQAILEGPEEIILGEHNAITEIFNDISLFIKPKSFFQTHPVLAEKLYATAAKWGSHSEALTIWDLFCGVGGFGLHALKALQKISQNNVSLVGIEIEPNAIESAKKSASELGLKNVTFDALDSTLFTSQNRQSPNLLIVNPPRRGLGNKLAEAINQLETKTIIYSSCHVDSLAKDLSILTSYRINKIQLFDFFPHTTHFEVLVELVKQDI
ncbi:23S rRNA (uracil747-C5)-methyltransferase [Thorsellia anophelis DSM 18579]|uniref:23S rRNA (uracil(747)-C(5))-methyltransferase RlmC n=2 Tax=Thorsellia anophelis TaxID=336804 RepID=A0A1I0EG89_9GAMM|nr:23S rRNA (uracil747-C5)-methyltransferase [Thorsellia anophelis DSM 18579]